MSQGPSQIFTPTGPGDAPRHFNDTPRSTAGPGGTFQPSTNFQYTPNAIGQYGAKQTNQNHSPQSQQAARWQGHNLKTEGPDQKELKRLERQKRAEERKKKAAEWKKKKQAERAKAEADRLKAIEAAANAAPNGNGNNAAPPAPVLSDPPPGAAPALNKNLMQQPFRRIYSVRGQC